VGDKAWGLPAGGCMRALCKAGDSAAVAAGRRGDGQTEQRTTNSPAAVGLGPARPVNANEKPSGVPRVRRT
jgi:hypothetical protein